MSCMIFGSIETSLFFLLQKFSSFWVTFLKQTHLTHSKCFLLNLEYQLRFPYRYLLIPLLLMYYAIFKNSCKTGTNKSLPKSVFFLLSTLETCLLSFNRQTNRHLSYAAYSLSPFSHRLSITFIHFVGSIGWDCISN